MSDSSDLTHVTDYNNTHLISSHLIQHATLRAHQIKSDKSNVLPHLSVEDSGNMKYGTVMI